MSDESVESYKTWDRGYVFTRDTVQKRTLTPAEWTPNMEGIPMEPWRDKKYLLNEHAALQFIAKHTTIPVPRVIAFSLSEDDCSLTTEFLNGVTLLQINEADKPRALENCQRFIEQTVLPQFRSLRSGTIGGLAGDILPPERVRQRSNNRKWKSSLSIKNDFVFCHNDLAQHNILVDPITLQVTGIIDWEYSGFYPQYFEVDLWKLSFREHMLVPQDKVDAQTDEMIDFLVNAETSDGKTDCAEEKEA